MFTKLEKEKLGTRDVYGRTLLEIGKQNKDVVVNFMGFRWNFGLVRKWFINAIVNRKRESSDIISHDTMCFTLH